MDVVYTMIAFSTEAELKEQRKKTACASKITVSFLIVVKRQNNRSPVLNGALSIYGIDVCFYLYAFTTGIFFVVPVVMYLLLRRTVELFVLCALKAV